ncbi:MAG: NAD-dependent epimerase/dehydratase family protein [Verrucomicrobiales bacterium]
MTKILITGVCGFVGSSLARVFAEQGGFEIFGVDNFIRPGSSENRVVLQRLGVKLIHGDIRAASDLECISPVDWLIDAAANPSVLAGIDGHSSSRQVIEHNLGGTINLLEFCKRHRAGFLLLSTSRVYSVPPLAALPVREDHGMFVLATDQPLPPSVTAKGVQEEFSTQPPLSLYGTSKLASELLALEYGEVFGFPVFINRCGVMAGAGQFGRPDQGIFAFWLNSHLRRRPLKYLGFGGHGYQVRDVLHPADLGQLLFKQISRGKVAREDRVLNVSGGVASAISLKNLTAWCDAAFGPHPVAQSREDRRFDIPWMVLDPSRACRLWDWQPNRDTESILQEIAEHAQQNPDWLELSKPF